MSLQHNHVTLMGNLTRDPELRHVTNGNQVASFAIAVNRSWRDTSGELHEECSFIDCEAWSRLAETIAQYLTKGSPAFIEGRLRQDHWQDDEGRNRSKIKVVCTNVQFLASPRQPGRAREDDKPASANPSPRQQVSRPAPRDPELVADGLPPEGEPPF